MKKAVLRSLLAMALVWGMASVGLCTDVAGTIASDTTWNLAGSPYIVTNSITVAAGATLTVAPGTEVRFNRNQGIWVDGTLSAVGTAASPITFTGTTETLDWWRGISIEDAGTASFEWCDIGYAGYSSEAGILKSGSGSLTIKNSKVHDHGGDGLRIAAGYSAFVSSGNTFSNNTYGVRLGINASFEDNTSDFEDNAIDVYVDGGTITGDTAWHLKKDYSLYISSSITVAETGSLTVKAGTVVKLNGYQGIWISGVLDVGGTSSEPVYFTDWRDDTVGGNANKDGNDSAPAAGWWRGIFVQGNGSTTLDWCTIRYAGYSMDVGLSKTGSGGLTMTRCTVSHTGGNGLEVQNSTGAVTLTQCVFTENTESGLYMNAGPVTAQGCTFSNNGTYGVFQEVNDSLVYTGNIFTGNGAGGVGVGGGNIYGNITFQPAGNPFVVNGSVTVDDGAALTLEPGTVVKFKNNLALWVNGTLSAAGTETDIITFTGITETSNAWRSIGVQNNGSAAFDWCHIGYGGYSDNAGILKTGTGALTLKNSTIHHHGGDGLRIAAGYSAFVSAGNTFSNNGNGVRLGINASFEDNTSDFEDNNVDVLVDGGAITGDVVWQLKKDYSLYIYDSITVTETGNLTVKSGTMVKPRQYVAFWVNGILNVTGTSTEPVVFTDWRDDTVGGDANGDGDASAPAAGWWRGVFVQETTVGSGSATLKNCTIRYAGYSYGVGLSKTGSGDLTMTGCTVSHIAGNGLEVENSTGTVTLSQCVFTENTQSGLYMNSGYVTAQGCTFSNNGTYGIFQEADDSLVYTGNTFSGNGAGGVGVGGGTITGNITWLAAGSPYVVTNTITVDEGATLTIAPGVVVKFDKYRRLYVDGTLTAVGKPSSPITFTGATESLHWWGPINIRNNGSATFDWCDIGYGAYSDNAGILKTDTGSLTLKNSTIHHHGGDGLRIFAGYSEFISAGNTFSNNGNGVRLGINASFEDNTSDFEDNNVDIRVDGGTITGDTAWQLKKDYSLYIYDSITVDEDASLTVKPGTVVKLKQFTGFWIDGRFTARGTSSEPVYFTDWRDDTVGGDANGDGFESLPAAQWWRVIHVRNNGSADFEWCNIAYGGYSDNTGILKTGTGSLTLKNSTIHHQGGDGLRIDNSTGEHVLFRCAFDNSGNGILVKNQVSPILIAASRFEQHTGYAVVNQNSAEIDARGNWWGDETGPLHVTLNPEGLGEKVSDGVLFDPWRTTPSLAEILSPGRSGTLVQGDGLRLTGSALEDPGYGYAWNLSDGRTFSEQSPGMVSFPTTGDVQVAYGAVKDGQPDANPDTRTITVVADTGMMPDLQAAALVLPGSIAVGQSAVIAYTARNAGQGAVSGEPWKDALYLSQDPYLDAGDILLGSVPVAADVAVGASYQNSMKVMLPAVSEGAWHVILSVNDEWAFLEKHRLNNEKAVSVNLQIPALEDGVGRVVDYEAGDVAQVFSMAAGEGENLVLDFGPDAAGLEVYVRYGDLPDRRTHDFRLTGGRLSIPSATSGTWYLLVYGTMPRAGQYDIEYSITSVSVSGVTPSRFGTLHDQVLTLSGAGFVSPLAVALVDGEGGVYSADTVEVDAYTQAMAGFTAGAVPAGVYSVRVTQGTHTDELPGAVEVVAGGTPKFETNLILPAQFGYHYLATVYVEYKNAGDAPMPSPLLVVTASQENQGTPGAVRNGAIMTLDASRLSSGFWTSALPEGFSNAVQFLASGENPGILQPGESGRVPVYYAGWQKPWDFSYPPFEWQVGVLDADDTTPVDWTELKGTMKPDHIREDAWDAVWENFTALAGSTWGDYVRMLSRNAAYLHRQGQGTDDIEMLLALSFRKADGFCPLPVSAASTDVFIEATGMPLSFERVHAQTISRRYELEPFGRGWRHNWQYSLAEGDDGTVVITDPSATPRIFQPDSRYSGRYLAQPGDSGVLRTSGANRVLTESDGLELTFNETGAMVSLKDTNGNSIACDYSGGRLTGLRHSSGPYLLIRYDGNGMISEITDHLDRASHYTYAGEYLASREAYDGLVTTYTNNAAPGTPGFHGLTGIRLPDGTGHFFEYNDQGWLKSAYGDADSERLDFVYADGGQVQVTDSMNHANRYYFDNWGRLIRTENPLGEVRRMIFDDIGNLVEKIDPDGVSRKFSYDRNGNLIESVRASRYVTRMTYTRAFNRLASVRDPGDRHVDYTHDSDGNLVVVSYEDGSRETWTYDERGNPIQGTNQRGGLIKYAYDGQGRLTGKTYPDDTQTSCSYDSHGNLLSATDVRGDVMEFTWDEHDYLVRIDYPGGRWLEFTYDAVGRRVGSENQLGHLVLWRYDALGRLEAVSDGDGDLVTYAYDALGRLSRKTFANGTYAMYAYDAAGRLLRLANHRPDGGILSFFDYAYDRLGRRTGMATHYGEWTYAYDDSGQLVEATLASSLPEIPDQAISYSYDLSGNRVQVMKNGEPVDYSTNMLNQYITAGDRTMRYDTDGNLVEEAGPEGIVTYGYDSENQLISVTKGRDVWEYGYDALGNRVHVTHNGDTTHYVFDPFGMGNLVGAYAEDGQWLAGYAHGLGLVGKAAPGAADLFYAFDPMGNASELTSVDGQVKNRYAYLPFGSALIHQESVGNPFQFGGDMGVMAEENGRHLMRARYYDSRDGRFTSLDPIGIVGGDMNLYRYAANNPVHRADPTGLSCNKKARPGSAKRRFVETYTRYHDHINMRNVKKHPSGLTNFEAWADKYTGLRAKAHRQVPGVAVEMLNDDVIEDSWWSWVPGYEWFSGANNLADALGGVNDARNPGTSCRWNRDRTKAPRPPARAGGVGASYSVGSVDPNEKQATAGYGAPNYLADGAQVAYRIDFENMESASAPAQFVTVRDKLSEHLDLATLELLEAGFGDVVIPIPRGRQYFNEVIDYNYTDDDYDFSIQVRVEIWLQNGTLYANFTSLDPENAASELPPPVDVGFLMPENETGRGQGYVSFAVAPKPGLPSSTSVRNIATIRFDGQTSIDTNQVDPMDPEKGTDPAKEALVTFDTGLPSSTMAPLPAEVHPSFAVSWSGTDADSGIAGYDVYVKEDDGQWTRWLDGTSDVTATYTGKPAHRYAFYVVATDNAGNREAKSSLAEASTVVMSPLKGDVNGDYEIDLTDPVMALQLCADIETGAEIHLSADVDADSRIGIAEAIYGLQHIAGLRE
jgi:RHS repeat-associated protein